MKKFLVPLAAIALTGLAACSGNQGAENAADNATIESNLTSVDELLANDVAFGNDAALSNDSGTLADPVLNGSADPALNTTGNDTGL